MAPGGGAPGRAGGAEGLGKGWGAQRVSPALPREGRQAEEQTWKMLQGGDGVGGTGCGTSYTSPCVGLRVPLSPRYPRGQMASTTSNTAANSIRASLVSPGGDVPKPRGRAALALERMGSARTQPRQHRPGGGAVRTGCCHPRRARGGGSVPRHKPELQVRAAAISPSPASAKPSTDGGDGKKKHAARSYRQEPFPRLAAEVFFPRSPASPSSLGFATSFAQRLEAALL